MAECGLYFGNAEHMTWLPAPDGEAGASYRGWGVSGGFINGGAFVRRSLTHHMAYQFNWTMKSRAELAKIEDFYGGRYGEGPFYMVMPGTHDNILPKSWSMPRTTLKDGPSLVYENPPTAANLTASNGRPPVAARYEINDEELEKAELILPVPPGYFLHFGVHGTFTGDARIELNGMAIAPLPNDAEEMTNTVIDQPGLYSISLQGTGTATIAAMTARLAESGDAEDLAVFVPGRGASAVEFEPDSLDITVSSAAKDFYHGTATLIEVGQWA